MLLKAIYFGSIKSIPLFEPDQHKKMKRSGFKLSTVPSLRFFFSVLTGAFPLMVDAFYNGFPIVYSDTSTYLASGFELETPVDRPITYGLFVRISSLNGVSLWMVVFFQAIILSYLIFLLIKQITDEKSYLKIALVATLFLSLFTGLSWTVSQVMPDIFTPIALVSAVLILVGRLRKNTLLFVFLIYAISVMMHLSHILMFSLIILVVFLVKKFILPPDRNARATRNLAIMFLITIGSVIMMGSSLAKSKHVFFMGAMAEQGILKKYLDEHCVTDKYLICAYKDSIPKTFNDFVWKEDSPLYKMGGWKATKKEYSEIISGTLTEPKYIALHIKESVKATFRQLIRFDIGDGNGVFSKGTLLHERVSRYFKHDLASYESSRQNQSSLYYLQGINIIFRIVVVISILFIFIILIIKKFVRNFKLNALLFISFTTILINAWDCGTFSMVTDRFGCKLTWLVPFVAVIYLLEIIKKRATAKDDMLNL